MPEFILDYGSPEGARAFRNLDSFTQGYIEAMFFTDCEHGSVRDPAANRQYRAWDPETDSSLPGDVAFSGLAPETLARIVADCAAFQETNETLLAEASELVPGEAGLKYAREALDDTRLGQLFWYARNGHGVAFTDDGNAPCLEALQRAARHVGQTDSYLGDDGLIYLS